MRNIIIAIIIMTGMLGTGMIVRDAYKSRVLGEETVRVTGGAEVSFSSDLAVWHGDFERSAGDLKTAYNLMKDDEKKIRSFLEKNGFTGSTISINPPTVNKEYSNEYGANGQMTSIFAGYRLSQSVSVESNNIDQIEKVSREASSLIESGVTLSSYTPSYYYTKLSDVKLSLLEKATAQANERAKVLAENSHTNLLRLKDANMGVFQILGKNSNEDYSEYGTFNTDSREKRATITVRAEYIIGTK
jgi:hypothetical protein